MRKRICVILMGLHADYTGYLVSGLSDQAHVLGYDVDVYSYFGLRILDNNFMNGEANILNLIVPENYDAFITYKGLIEEKHIRDQIDEICRLSGKPYFDVEDEETTETDYPMHNDREKFRRLTEHFITVHKHRKIYCITGYKGFHQSENRLLGYRDAMRAHGIEPEPDWEYYGDFWKHYTRAFADKLASGEIAMPEAVICAATAPAITLIERLREHGIHVPRDLAVGGYDFAFEGEMCEPTVTSISFPYYNNGIKAACRIHKMMTGKLAEPVPFREEDIRIGASCGCNVLQRNRMTYFRDIMLERLEYRELFRNSGFRENISKAESTDAFFGKLKNLNYVIRGIKIVHYFLCDDWDGIHNVKDSTYRTTGYSDDLFTYIFSRDPDNVSFSVTKRTDFLQTIRTEEHPSTHFFFPMHYGDRVLGFAALCFKENRFTPDELFRDYLETFNNALETLRIRQYITRFSERINLAVIRDPLTGTYNRRGFEELSAEIYENAAIHGECFMIAAVKIYNLSEVNHSIGYREADKLLVRLAEILNEGCQGNEVCCHVRADMFYIVGSHHTSSRERSAYVKKYRISSGSVFLSWKRSMEQALTRRSTMII
ncbi:MAG: substrate-binding domain-containing protein [Ruminococcus sp.]|nr:substrate-binding domain-containing protein [Ruminococcus sp.]